MMSTLTRNSKAIHRIAEIIHSASLKMIFSTSNLHWKIIYCPFYFKLCLQTLIELFMEPERFLSPKFVHLEKKSQQTASQRTSTIKHLNFKKFWASIKRMKVLISLNFFSRENGFFFSASTPLSCHNLATNHVTHLTAFKVLKIGKI